MTQQQDRPQTAVMHRRELRPRRVPLRVMIPMAAVLFCIPDSLLKSGAENVREHRSPFIPWLIGLAVIWMTAGILRSSRVAITFIHGHVKSPWLTLPITITALWAITFWGVYIAQINITSQNAQMDFRFAVQIFSGNWSSPPYVDQDGTPKATVESVPLRMATSISVALVLNLLALGLLAWVTQLASNIRRSQMLDRDKDLKALKIVEGQEVTKEIEAAFEQLSMAPPSDLRKRIDGALDRSRARYEKLLHMAPPNG